MWNVIKRLLNNGALATWALVFVAILGSSLLTAICSGRPLESHSVFKHIPRYETTYTPSYHTIYIPDYSATYIPDYSATYIPDYSATYTPDKAMKRNSRRRV